MRLSGKTDNYLRQFGSYEACDYLQFVYHQMARTITTPLDDMLFQLSVTQGIFLVFSELFTGTYLYI